MSLEQTSQMSRLDLPGWNLPLNWTTHAAYSKPVCESNEFYYDGADISYSQPQGPVKDRVFLPVAA
jgi:hypothetical protein